MPRGVPVRVVALVVSALSTVACASSPRRHQAPVEAPRSATSIESPRSSEAPVGALAGRWEGVLRLPGSIPSRLAITLDSSGGCWQGALTTAAAGRDPIPFASVSRSRDTLELRLPATAQNTVLTGALSADGTVLAGTISGSDGAAFRTARAGSPEAAALVAEAAAGEASRRRAARMVDSSAVTPHADPDSAKLVTSDIALFWHALDVAPKDSLGPVLQREYLDRASVGVRDFIPGRILSAEDLAAYVAAHRAKYDSVRAAKLDVTRAESEIRASFHRLKTLYPPAVFPDVYFVIGRFNSGGTSSDHGLLIGAEMYRDPARLPAIVSHELIHYQQHYPSPTLLENAFKEGTADFVGEMISGAHINNPAHRYGMAHEHELWKEFLPHADDRTFYPWMYGTPTDGRPNDLGYFIGYRIAKAYYDKATDKRQAIADIITARGGKVRELLELSGYDP